MKEVSITELKKLQAQEIKKGGSFRLTADGEVIALVMVPMSGDKRNQLEALASQMNASAGVVS